MKLGVREVATHMGVSENTVFRWVERDGLPATQVDGQFRFHPEAVYEWATELGLPVAGNLFGDTVGSLDHRSLDPSDPRRRHRGRAARRRQARGHGRRDGETAAPPHADRSVILQMLLARAKLGTVGVAEGFAIPHVRDPIVLRVAEPQVTLFLLEHPIDFDGRGRRPVHALFLIVTPTIRGHLLILSRIGTVLLDENRPCRHQRPGRRFEHHRGDRDRRRHAQREGRGLTSAPGDGGPAGLILASAALMAVSGMIAGLFRSRPMVADRVAAGLLGLGAAVGLGGAMAAVASPAAHGLAWPWALPWGRLVVAVDGISAAFLFPTLLVPALAGIYGVGYWSQQAHPESAARVRVFLGLLAGAMTTLLIARDAVLFLMAFEVMTLSAFFLVTTEDGRSEVREAGWVYLAASHTSFLTLLAMFAALHALTGSFDLTAVAPSSMGLGARSVLFLLALVAFGIKAGVMPFHVWLPPAHASAPSHVSALMSGVLIKIGIYGIVRVLEMLPEPPVAWGVLLLLLGAASGIGGVAFAIAQHDIKRLLAYHSIENIGIIVMGIGLAVVGRATHAPLLVVLGLGAAVLHVWNHAIFKALLFLSAGVVVHATGTRDIDRMGGSGAPSHGPRPSSRWAPWPSAASHL